MFVATPNEALAQWLCGDCVGWFEPAHVFVSVGDSGDRRCDQAGCHYDWYTGGCEIHGPCESGFSRAEIIENEDALAAAIEAGDAAKIQSALRVFPDWEYNSAKRTLTINNCGGVLVARFSIAAGINLPRA
ncbi:MAG: hypothetical protein ACT443_00695, partial [Gemmatimonadota bacterium]